MVRCKFTCVSITKRKGWHGSPSEFIYDAKFSAITKQDTASTREGAIENEQFWEATPFGELNIWEATPFGELNIGSVRADVFEVGKDYYLDLTPTEDRPEEAAHRPQAPHHQVRRAGIGEARAMTEPENPNPLICQHCGSDLGPLPPTEREAKARLDAAR